VKSITNVPSTLRVVPSGGARHPFETYILVNKVEGLQRGLYRFLALSHKLVEHNLEDGLGERVTEICWNQRFIMESAITLIWTLIPYRGIWRYGERAFRSILEVGHICQNLYLSAEAIDCGVCAIMAFGDDAINNLLGVDGVEQFVVYMATVGKRK
jgi:SagB-type dehydrogenase family enzyme